MVGRMYKEVFTKMLSMSQAGLYKMHEQVTQGLQLWLRLLQLGVSVVPGKNHRPYRQCEQHCDVTRFTERKSSQAQGPS